MLLSRSRFKEGIHSTPLMSLVSLNLCNYFPALLQPMSFPMTNTTSALGLSASNPSNTGITLNNTLGALLIGYSFACMVFGILTTQVFNYFQRFAVDSPIMKTLVSVIEGYFCGGTTHILIWRWLSYGMYTNFDGCHEDAIIMIIMIIIHWFHRSLEAFHVALISHVIYHYTISYVSLHESNLRRLHLHFIGFLVNYPP